MSKIDFQVIYKSNPDLLPDLFLNGQPIGIIEMLKVVVDELNKLQED